MPSAGLFTSKRKEGALALVALALLFAPLWVPVLHLDDPTYRYERVEVVSGDDGLGYASDDPELNDVPISTEIGCSIPQDVRVCAFEQFVYANHTVPTRVYTNNPDLVSRTVGYERYRYVVLNGTAFAPVSVPNRSVRNDEGLYREDLGLRPVPLESALRAVSLNASLERDEIPPAVYEAAVSGTGTAPRRVNVPETPIRLDNGEYYRVYFEGRTTAPTLLALGDRLLTYGGPFIGIGMLVRLSRRVEISYVGSGTEQ